MSKKEVLASCNPNRHGRVALTRYTDTGFETSAEFESVYVVTGPGDYEAEFDTQAQAQRAYDAEVAHWAKEPNWAAQAEYDAEHGTINGYAPWQYGGEY